MYISFNYIKGLIHVKIIEDIMGIGKCNFYLTDLYKVFSKLYIPIFIGTTRINISIRFRRHHSQNIHYRRFTFIN